jgi:PhnB protein
MTVHELFPYLCVRDTSAAIEFYGRAFGAEEKFRLTEPSGRVGHAEIVLGGHVVMLCDEFPEHGIRAPGATERVPMILHLHVDDADAAMRRALAAGATLVRAASDAFYGERSGRVRDPFGHEWLLGHAIEEVAPEEMQRRYTALFEGVGDACG